MSTLELKELSHPSGEVIKIAAGKTLDLKTQGSVTMPTGSVLQVLSVTKYDTFSLSSMTFTDVTGLSIAITPSSTSSKILVELNINVSASGRYAAVRLFRDSTQIGGGTAEGVRTSVTISANGSNDNETNQQYIMRNSSASFLDSPSTTSETTYKVKIANTNTAGQSTHVNRTVANDNGNYSHRGISTLTLTEIQG